MSVIHLSELTMKIEQKMIFCNQPDSIMLPELKSSVFMLIRTY